MKLFEIQETRYEFFTKREEIKAWLDSNGVERYTIHNDLIVDVDGTVDLSNLKNMIFLPVQFGEVSHNFYIKYCMKLQSLKGCPRVVGQSFSCYGCLELTSFVGGPKIVGRNYSCGNCLKLAGFEGAPTKVAGNLSLYGCAALKSFKDIHKYVESADRIDAENINIKSNLLGLLKIKDLRRLDIEDQKLQNIINKYLPEGDILACVDELEDAGFEEFAKL